MISRYEKGDRGLPLEFMFKLFDVLDILPGQFFGPPQMPTLDLFAMPLGSKERKSLIEVVKVASKLSEADRQELLQAIRPKLSTDEKSSTQSETA